MTQSYQDIPEQRAIMWEDFLMVLRIYWVLILFTVAATLISAYTTVQLLTKQYETSAEILVKLGRENTGVPTSVGKGEVVSAGIRREEINSEIRMLISRPLIDSTLDKIGIDAFFGEPPPPTTFLEKIKFSIKLVAKKFSQGIEDLLIGINLRKKLTPRESITLLIQKSLSVERVKDSDVIMVAGGVLGVVMGDE